MAERPSLHDQTATLLREVSGYHAEDLEQIDTLGALNLRGAVQPFESLLSLIRLIPFDSLELFSDNLLTSLKNRLEVVKELRLKALALDPLDSQIHARRDEVMSQARQEWESMLGNLLPHIALGAAFRQIYFQDRVDEQITIIESEVRHSYTEASSSLSKLIADTDTVKREAESTLAAVRTAAAEAGVSQQAGAFKQSSRLHDSASCRWLWVSIALAASVLAWSFFSPLATNWLAKKGGGELPIEQIIATKVSVFAVLSFMLVVASRNYLAHRHNATINRHRQNALITFRAIVKAAGPENRDAILQHAAACIFAPQSTGYSRESQRQQVPLTNIIEAVGNRVAGGADV